ncbi:hypothetical protein [Sinosporangium siamense]|uniref:Uncharacterized protein n=1 Tax=Sinosporangium siamense TaxID=1367973 RepID=A0A919RFK9_9ACTN|nr:hypothetical protein [Sinosporangium siamense]GII92991.1 hypothetical protein Ssi02_32220 [Sinosporangium siamense]
MNIAALITWIITALGGFYMLGTWLARGGARGGSHLPVPVIFGHFALAATGLIIWIIYLIIDMNVLAWIALGLLVLVAVLGFVMLSRWIPVYRSRTAALAAGELTTPAERHFPVAVVAGHGLFAVATVILVLLSALDIGGS